VALRNVDVGFQGGQVLTLRLDEGEHRALVDALRSAGEGRSVHTVRAQEAEVVLDLARVAYVRCELAEQRVGF
jgi:hypothetical protein